MRYAGPSLKTYNTGDRTFYDAITIAEPNQGNRLLSWVPLQ